MLKSHLNNKDDITNNSGFGYACTPWVGKDGDKYYLSAQTHWDYSGEERGRPFIKEVKKFFKANGIKVKIKTTYYA